jgi:tetratricopeptide (TPR) repeat protein
VEGEGVPENEAQRLASFAIERACVALELRRHTVAEREARAALALWPQSVDARVALVEALCGQRRFEEAGAVVDEALALEPNWVEVQLLACLVFCEQRDRARALAAANAHASLAPESAMTHVLYAEISSLDGDVRSTIDATQRALAIDPSNVRALELLGLALTNVDPRQAEQVFLRQLAIAPNDSVAVNNLGVALERQKRYWEAAKLFESAVRLDPTNALARSNTRLTINRWASPAFGVGLGGVLMLGSKGFLLVLVNAAAQLVTKAPRAALAAAVLVLLLIAGGVLLYTRGLRVWRLRRLAREDPGLHEMFRNLERDQARDSQRAPP